MSDIVIRSEDGWIEVTDLVKELFSQQLTEELWGQLTEKKMEDAIDLLTKELGSDLFRRIDSVVLREVFMMHLPGEGFRIWARK